MRIKDALKVGSTYKIASNLEERAKMADVYLTTTEFSEEMKLFEGQVVMIDEVIENHLYGIKDDSGEYAWPFWCFEECTFEEDEKYNGDI